MRKGIFLMVLLCSFLISAIAQKGNSNIHLSAEAGIATKDGGSGFGGLVKGLYGIGRHGQLTLTAGISKFNSDDMPDAPEATTRLVSFMLGYRHNLCKFYIEPQAGIGELGGKYSLIGDYSRPSVAAFIWSVGAGVRHRRLDAGLRYVNSRGIEGAEAGTWHDRKFSYASAYVGIALWSR